MRRNFGIELEIVNLTEEKADAALRAIGMEVVRRGYTHDITREWKIVPDGSVKGDDGRAGCEAVSPILSGEAGLDAAGAAANALKAMGAAANRTCGYHVHMNAEDLTAQEVKTILRRYAAFEAEIDALMPRSRRADKNAFCKGIRSFVESAAFQNARNIDQLVRAQGGRYFKVNLQSYHKYKTIEFRQHGGSVDADHVVQWIRFLDAFIAESIRIARNPAAPAPVAAPVAASAVAGRRLTASQQRALDMIRQPDGTTAEAIAERLNIKVISARAVVTNIRQAGYNVRAIRCGAQTRYEIAGDAVPAPAPAAPVAAADSLYAGVDAAITTFYRNRAAVLAIAS